MKPDDVVLAVLKEKEGFTELLEAQELKPDWIKLLLKIFALISKSDMRANVIDLYSMLIRSPLIGSEVINLVQELPVQSTASEATEEFIDNVLTVFEKISLLFTRSLRSLPVAELVLILPVLNIERQEEFKSRTNELVKARTACVKDNSRQNGRNFPFSSCLGAPPEDFRELSIVPSYEDLRPTKEPYLRPIKERGQYSDGEEYLDVQFRLMKEDFLAPLREGLKEILLEKEQRKRKIHMRVYQNVRIKTLQCSRGGITHRIQLDAGNRRSFRWKHAKRLLIGSLLCFSKDKFETFIFATVANRRPLLLEEGQIDVHFLDGFENSIDVEQKIFDMVESPAFYEAYQHVLRALQQIQGDAIPFSKYIVLAESEPELPKYLRDKGSVEYNLEGCLTDEGTPCKASLFDIHNWGTRSVLNTSQLIAVQKALTRDFVVIQGPPGTGKTYVGLKIAHTLLNNAEIAKISNILVVCYTNHALDQFVKGLLDKGHKNIIRCGGRCRNEGVLPYTLQEKVKTEKENKVLPPSALRNILHAKSSSIRQKKNLEDQLHDATEQLEWIRQFEVDSKVLPYEVLAPYIPEHLRDWFCGQWLETLGRDIPYLEKYLSLHRLNVVVDSHESRRQNKSKSKKSQHETEEEVQRSGQEDDSKFVDVDGEVEELTNRWEIDEEQFAVDVETLLELEEGEIIDDEQNVDSEDVHNVLQSPEAIRNKVKSCLRYSKAMGREEADSIIDPEALDVGQRWMFYKYLLAQYMSDQKATLIRLANAYDEKCAQIKELDQRKEEYYIEKSRVIAMTTTCAARYRQVLSRINPQIIIIEEAAEVLEAHVITSLTEGVEHVILIGDHKQLKPKPTDFTLAKKYNLELSLFERMIRNGMDCHCLNIQHRMRPEISALLRDIYPNLQDHPSVAKYPNVLGVGTNLHFIDHSHLEDENVELKSKSNEHEAKFIVALCRYLLLQGYSPDQITILTLYTGQLLFMKGLMPKSEFQGVRVSCVDNFQGEECDIVLLSLVRSNEDDIIGFAGEENRICVSLSRAKVGLFVIGNFTLLASKSSVWKSVVSFAEKSNSISKFLPLFCQSHPGKEIKARTADDFNDAPAGGCKEPCIFRLKCGHACQKACHPHDQEHRQVVCKKKCDKVMCDNGHKCQKTCHFDTNCGLCMVDVQKVLPECGHNQLIACSGKPEYFDCKVLVERELRCGHVGQMNCYVKSTGAIQCNEPCQADLECGHKCSGTCSECYQGRVHRRCQQKCERTLVCSHICKENCSKACPPCTQPCSITCVHSKCPKRCGEKCTPCRERCSWQCEHKKCNKVCYEICDREPCNEPCRRTIKKCGHPCVGLCGEQCPKLCRICNKEELEEIFFGSEDEEDARFLQLSDCKHVFEVGGLDKYMQLEEGETSVALKSCPKCKVPITKSLRYGNSIKKKMKDVEKVKKLVIAQRRDTSQFKALSDIKGALREMPYGCSQLAYYWVISGRVSDKTEMLFGENELERISENQVQMLQRIVALIKNVNIALKASKAPSEVMQNITEIMSLASYITKICLQNTISRQQLSDIDLELSRLSVFCTTLSTCHDPHASEIPDTKSSQLSCYLEVLRTGRRVIKSELHEMKLAVEELREDYGMQTLSKEEKEMIIKVMDLSAGHWYKCPNGHVYAIGECGGAMEESRCPECNATIGGIQHRLVEGNAHAGEFDGSRHAAWSEGANLANFDPNEFAN